MKKIILVFALFAVGTTFAQDISVDDVNSRNSWLKIGLNSGIPVGDADELASFTLGLDLKGQYLVNPNFGIGVATGYTHFFAKDGFEDFGVVPIAGFARYYFQKEGLFLGADFGYGFLTGIEDAEGGLYLNPQIGYHNRDWNFFAYYQNTFAEGDIDLSVVGIGATYNVRF